MSVLSSLITHDVIQGKELAGDDLEGDLLKDWYDQESEAYRTYLRENEEDPLGEKLYLNYLLGAVSVCDTRIDDKFSVLIIGPGKGLEVDLILELYPDALISIIEPSRLLRDGLMSRYEQVNVVECSRDSYISSDSNSYDLIIAMGVLHHVPLVSNLLSEIKRVLKPSGTAYLREPCSAMLPWLDRECLTPNERGIPQDWMGRKLSSIGLKCVSRAIGFDRLFKVLPNLTPISVVVYLDRVINRIIQGNNTYWRDTFFKKIGPSSYEYVIKK